MSGLMSLLRNRQGSAIPIVAFGALAMVGAAGLAIDMGRAQMVQSRLSAALDAAGLAAGADINTTNLSTEVNKYFYANFPSGYMDSTITSLTASINADNSVITLSATANVPTALMKLFGKTTVAVGAASEITRANKGMELVLVLDTTGSMNCPVSGSCGSTTVEQPNSKISNLRAAATSLINILYGSNETIDDLWVGIVPFSQSVNIGTSRAAWVNAGSFAWGTSTWNGCVTARWAGGRDTTDDPPSVALFDKYYFPCDSNNGWYGTNSSKTNCTPSGSGFGYKSNSGGPGPSTYGPNLYCPQSVLAMTASKTTVLNKVAALTAIGGTEIPLGLAWGWRMLSPQWQGLWGGDMDTDDLPLAYKTPLMNKVVILMTDGDNDIAYNWYSAYGYPNSGGLNNGATPACNTSNGNCSTGEGVLNTRTSALCTSMKDPSRGIIIYTIAFGTNINATSKTMLQNCASKPEYFFDSPDNATLQNAFQQIGDSLANLRISK